MARLDNDILLVNQDEYARIEGRLGTIGRSSRDMAGAVLPLLFTISQQEAQKLRVCFVCVASGR